MTYTQKYLRRSAGSNARWPRRITIGMVMCLNAWGVTLQAQTRFSPPDTAVNLAAYASGEECFAALSRVMDRIEAENSVWQDTLYLERTQMLDSLSSVARGVARECAARHRADTLPVEQYERWVPVFLAADRDADARLVVERRLATFAPDNVAARKLVLQRVYGAYQISPPFRVATMESILDQLEQLATGDRILDRFEPMLMQLELAQSLFDTVMERHTAERVVAFSETLTPQQRETRYYEDRSKIVHRALDIVRKKLLSDSLQKSAEAFIALKQANWAAASGRPSGTWPSMVGKRAAPIEADFWFSGDMATTSSTLGASPSYDSSPPRLVRPTPGRVGLLMFLQGGCHEEALDTRIPYGRESRVTKCWGTYAMLRRLAKRFPSLEITIVSKTSGYVGSAVPLPPRDEANLLRQWWLDYHHLPATLAVVNTQFFRLPAPDNRRIDQDDANERNYTIGETKSGFQRRAFIVDPDGVIIYASGERGTGEADFIRILDAVMARENRSATHR